MDTAFTPLKIQTHVKPIPSYSAIVNTFTPRKIQTHVKHNNRNQDEKTPFTPIKIQAHVKLQIPLFNSESWMSLSEVHLALNE